jgi:membrane glycosyltransferase
MGHSLGRHGLNGLEIAMLVVFTPLFYQLSTGFWTAIIGLAVSRKSDPLTLLNTLSDDDRCADLSASTKVNFGVGQ